MAKAITKGYTDTAFGTPADLNMDAARLNYAADFRAKSIQPSEVVATNVTCGLDQPEIVRVANREVSNVYAGLDIAAENQLATKKGTAVVFDLRQMWKETDSVDATYLKYLPIRATLTVTVPLGSTMVAGADVKSLIKRLLGLTFEANINDSARLTAVLRGIMKPSAIV